MSPNGEISMDSLEAQYPSSKADSKVGNCGILESAKSEIKETDNYYLISCRWWKHWNTYMREGTSNSNRSMEDSVLVYCSISSRGLLTSTDILRSADEKSELELNLTQDTYMMEYQWREPVNENYEYILMAEQTWKAFLKWYCAGLVSGGKSNLLNGFSLKDEARPLQLQLTLRPKGNHLSVRISKRDTAGELYQRANELFNLNSDHIRIWDYSGKLLDFSKIQDGENIQMDHDILLQVQVDESYPDENADYRYENGAAENEYALVPFEPSVSGGYTGNGMFPSGSSIVEENNIDPLCMSLKEDGYGQSGLSSNRGRVEHLGLIGLQNLGNTCFMNSALQCLAHTPELVEYFLQDYSREINRHNPLGMEGELAVAFGELLRKLWAPGKVPITPRVFKAKLARFAPQFNGYNQHDSQELLAFLLDGLHEDLNRVKLKPYIESKNADGRPDEEVANEYWDNHKVRNDSIIVDICQGQYKSTLVCPACKKVSITFDPFMYLSLPLPCTMTRTMTVTVFTSDGSAPPTPYTVTVPKQGICSDLFQAVGKACNLEDEERLLFAVLHSPFYYRLLENPLLSLSMIRDDDHVAAYRLPKISENAPLLFFTNCRPEENVLFNEGLRSTKNFGVPLVTWLPNEAIATTGKDLVKLFKTTISPIVNTDQPIHNLLALDNDDTRERQDNIDEENNQESHMHSSGTSNGNSFIVSGLDGGEGANDTNRASEKPGPFFRFFLSEEKYLAKETLVEIDKPLPVIYGSKAYNISVEWSEKACKKYDTKVLESLPQVFNSGFLLTPKFGPESISLYACLEAFLKEEPLGPDDMWYCPSCKEHRQATKKLDLWRLPEILVVHLKRFSYSRYMKNKLDMLVSFPIHDLDITKYIARGNPSQHQYVYDLFAISNHYGSMGGGHYTAYCKLKDDKWYNFDDSHVSEMSEKELKTSAAYVLFYRRRITSERSVKCNGLSTLTEPEGQEE